MPNSSQASAGREEWSGSLGFILAAAGSAIGLGNIWKFPYMTGENGGGAFVLLYLLCVAVVGVPVMLCELSIGRRARRDPVGAFRALSPSVSRASHAIGFCLAVIGVGLLSLGNPGTGVVMVAIGALVFLLGWAAVGYMGVICGFVIMSFYSVVGGWTIGYILQSAGKFFAGQPIARAGDAAAVAAAGEAFGNLAVNSPLTAVSLHLVFMAICVAVVYAGVKNGIERYSKILMPMLFIILIALIIRGITLDGAAAGVGKFLTPDFSKITGRSVLEAMGMAFFSLSLGMGAMITYGSYVPREENLFKSCLAIVSLDCLVAILAGLAIFPAVFAMGFDPQAGPGLVFHVLPAVFDTIFLGPLWATLFFILLTVAAVTSGISLIEVVVAFCVDTLGWRRHSAVLSVGAVIAAIGCLSAVSVGDWSRIAWLGDGLTYLFGEVSGSLFDLLATLADKYMMPIGGLMIAVFTGWIWGTRHAVEEIRHGSHNFADVHLVTLLSGLKDDPSHNADIHVLTLASVWGIFIRFVCPVIIALTFMYNAGWISVGAAASADGAPDAAAEIAVDTMDATRGAADSNSGIGGADIDIPGEPE